MTRSFNWIAGLSPVARNDVLSRARIRSLPDGAVLYRQGDITTEFFQIVDGAIRNFILNEQGQEVLINIYGPGDIVADSSAIDRDPFPVTVATRGATKLRVWSVADFRDLRSSHPEIDSALALQTSRRARALLMMIEELTTLTVASRVASRLALIAEHSDSSSSGVGIRLSQADLGLMVGSTRQSVNNTINELKTLQVIDTRYGKIWVQDLAGLRAYAAANSTRKS